MSNMKNTNHLTVAYGNVPEEVIMFASRDFGMDIDLLEGEINLTTVNDERTYAYYSSYENPVPDDILTNAIGCLHDHINNVPEEELGMELEQPGYHCCNKNHIAQPRLVCMDSLPDCIHCDVYRYVYYAQDCVVSVYYVKERVQYARLYEM